MGLISGCRRSQLSFFFFLILTHSTEEENKPDRVCNTHDKIFFPGSDSQHKPNKKQACCVWVVLSITVSFKNSGLKRTRLVDCHTFLQICDRLTVDQNILTVQPELLKLCLPPITHTPSKVSPFLLGLDNRAEIHISVLIRIYFFLY